MNCQIKVKKVSSLPATPVVHKETESMSPQPPLPFAYARGPARELRLHPKQTLEFSTALGNQIKRQTLPYLGGPEACRRGRIFAVQRTMYGICTYIVKKNMVWQR